MKSILKRFLLLAILLLIFMVILIWTLINPNLVNILLSITTAILGILPLFSHPNLKLDLEKFRDELIIIVKTQSWKQFSQSETLPRTGIKLSENDPLNYGEHSKYIRIKLTNTGNKVAENCKIKMAIYNNWGGKIHEDSLLYPAGQHSRKFAGEPPLPVNLSPSDSWIFDVCSTNNIFSNDRLIRFEDSYTFTKINDDINFLKTYIIRLKVSCDNFKSFGKNYKIFVNNDVGDILWRRLEIIEMTSKKAIRTKIFLKIKSLLKKNTLESDEFSEQELEKVDASNINTANLVANKGIRPSVDKYIGLEPNQDYTTGDKIDKT